MVITLLYAVTAVTSYGSVGTCPSCIIMAYKSIVPVGVITDNAIAGCGLWLIRQRRWGPTLAAARRRLIIDDSPGDGPEKELEMQGHHEGGVSLLPAAPRGRARKNSDLARRRGVRVQASEDVKA